MDIIYERNKDKKFSVSLSRAVYSHQMKGEESGLVILYWAVQSESLVRGLLTTVQYSAQECRN